MRSLSHEVIQAVLGLQEGVKYPEGGLVWLHTPTDNAMVYHPFVVASTAADPAWANSMLLHCKARDEQAHVCIPHSVILPRCGQLRSLPFSHQALRRMP
jgi:hypothetical protein